MGLKLSAKTLRAVEAAAVPGSDRRADTAAIAPGGLREWVILPPPPSTNNLFAHRKGVGGRVRTREYDAWRARAEPDMRTLAPPASLPCRFCVLLVGKWNCQRDGDNTIKPLQDLAVHCGVLASDSLDFVRGGQWDVLPLDRPACVVVWLEPWSPVADAAACWAELEGAK